MPAVRFTGKRLDPATIAALVSGTLVNGSAPSAWWRRQSADFRNNFMDTIRTSMRNGENLTQAINRVVGGTIDGVTVPGIMKTTKGKAGALVATSMSAVTNEAALASFQANNDVIKAVTQLSTLDNRTSDICIAYSGQTWDLNTLEPIMGSSLPFNGGPPRHFNCRSRLRPVTKSFKELGVNAKEIPPGTRASMDGQVPADITFNQFLKNKPKTFADDLLGPKRAELWRNGDITLTQLVDMRGRPLTITQLEQSIGIKPKPSFNPATNQTINKPKPKEKLTPPSAVDIVPEEVIGGISEAEAAQEILFLMQQEFNNEVANLLKEGKWLEVMSYINKASEKIPDKVKASAMARMNQAKEAAEKQAQKVFEKHFTPGKVTNHDEFMTQVAAGLMDDLEEASQAVRSAFVTKARLFKEAAQPKWDVEKAKLLLADNKAGEARTLLKSGEQTAEKQALIKEINKGAGKETAIIDDLEFALKQSTDEFDLVPTMESWNALVKTKINADDLPSWVRNNVLNSPRFASLEEWASGKEALRLVRATVDKNDLTMAKQLLDNINPQYGALADAKMQAEKLYLNALSKQEELKKTFVTDFKKGLKNEGISEADLALAYDDDQIKFFGDMLDWKLNEKTIPGAMKKIREEAAKLDTAISDIKKMNKMSQGVNDISQYANQLTLAQRQHPKFQEAIKKVTTQAQKKAEAGKKAFLNELSEQVDVDDLSKYAESYVDLMGDIHKKLGVAQTKDKIAQVKIRIENAKNADDLLVQSLSADTTDYASKIKMFMTRNEIDELDEIARMFFKNGNDSQARSKLFDKMYGKDATEKKVIKEYVHIKANPKSLPSGKNFNDAVNEIVVMHKTNSKMTDIHKALEAFEEGLDAGMKTNFRQTIFTRVGDDIFNIDDLGVVTAGDLTPAAARIRAKLEADGDVGEIPVPKLGKAENTQGAKELIGGSEEQWKRKADDYLFGSDSRSAPANFRSGEAQYGKDSYGISKEKWDQHIASTAFDPQDMELIRRYTGSMYDELNPYLWEGSTDSRLMRGASAMNSALEKMPKANGIQVYRGESFNGAKYNADFIEARYVEGSTVTQRGFWSTATQQAASFSKPGAGKDITFIIKAKGKKGAIIGPVSRFGASEMEVLYQSGAKFLVKKVQKRSGTFKIWLEEV